MAIAHFFDPNRKKRTGDMPETELALPPFIVDQNGYLMFRNPDLGGCSMFEVTPHVWDVSWTHLDDLVSKKVLQGRRLQASSGVEYGDARELIVRTWVQFVNSLLPKDSNTSQTHIQILGKKMKHERPVNQQDKIWVTEADYLFEDTMEKTKELNFDKEGNEAMRIRAKDYALFLADFSSQSNAFSVTANEMNLPVYDMRWYIVVSYTPSSEGWWYDGRDAEFYLVEDEFDLKHPLSMFSDPQIVDRITARFMRRRREKQQKHAQNTANDIFPLATDVTVQVIHSRILDIQHSYARIARSLPQGVSMPFSLRQMTGREIAATIAFFNDPLTPYWDKAMSMTGVNMNDVMMGLESDIAIITGDVSRVNRLAGDIISGSVDFSVTDAEVEAFRRRYAELSLVSDDEVTDSDDPFARLGIAKDTASDHMWEGLGFGTDAHHDGADDFISRYRRRNESIGYRKRNEQIRENVIRQEEEDARRVDWDDDLYRLSLPGEGRGRRK